MPRNGLKKVRNLSLQTGLASGSVQKIFLRSSHIDDKNEANHTACQADPASLSQKGAALFLKSSTLSRKRSSSPALHMFQADRRAFFFVCRWLCHMQLYNASIFSYKRFVLFGFTFDYTGKVVTLSLDDVCAFARLLFPHRIAAKLLFDVSSDQLAAGFG